MPSVLTKFTFSCYSAKVLTKDMFTMFCFNSARVSNKVMFRFHYVEC